MTSPCTSSAGESLSTSSAPICPPTVWLAVLAQTDAGMATVERAVIDGRSVSVNR
ncbi:hypothetical protein [Cutibacterium avidum]|uniref:hypothetical protein n=1 Tax=Cutibacterium avidum TaxID=33010 RepID=UPI001E3AD08D|nr:hypothetical protein [Cutibacterium avidum]